MAAAAYFLRSTDHLLRQRPGMWPRSFGGVGASRTDVHGAAATACNALLQKQPQPASHVGSTTTDSASNLSRTRLASEDRKADVARTAYACASSAMGRGGSTERRMVAVARGVGLPSSCVLAATPCVGLAGMVLAALLPGCAATVAEMPPPRR